MSTKTNPRTAGMYGLAFGDSWGYKTEFLSHDQITEKLHLKASGRSVISDDTQMSLYNVMAIQALKQSTGFNEQWQQELLYNTDTQNNARSVFAQWHLRYSLDEDNNRAPGMTVMSSLQRYKTMTERNEPFEYAGGEGGLKNNSKGCGSIMRAPWLGMIRGLSRDTIAMLGMLQSQTTHGHPASWIAASAAALITKDILDMRPETYTARAENEGKPNAELVYMTLDILDELRTVDTNWMTEAYIKELRRMRARVQDMLDTDWSSFIVSDISEDITETFGEGWTADEALYVSVAAASRYQLSPEEGVRRLIWTSGDSDSIAAVGGCFLYSDPRITTDQVSYMESTLEDRYREEMREATAIVNSF